MTLSDLEYIGVATAYVQITGRENQPYKIVGATIDLPLPVKLQLQIRQVSILWDEATLHRVNTTLMMALSSAFDMSPFTDLVDTLYAMRALQTIYGLLFYRAQVNKVQIMNYCSSLGYLPTPTGADVLRLMKDVRIFSFLLNIFTEQPLLPTSPLLLKQVLDGLLRMVHHLPYHV